MATLYSNITEYTNKYKNAQISLDDNEILFSAKLYNYDTDLKDGCSLTYDCSYITGKILSSGLKDCLEISELSGTFSNWNQAVRWCCNSRKN